MSQGTTLIERYFDAFNHHDPEVVMACFDSQAVIVAAHGRRLAGAGKPTRPPGQFRSPAREAGIPLQYPWHCTRISPSRQMKRRLA